MHKHHAILTGPTKPSTNIFRTKGPARMLTVGLMHSRWICKIRMDLMQQIGHLDTPQTVESQAYKIHSI